MDGRLIGKNKISDFFYWTVCVLTWICVALAVFKLAFSLTYYKFYVVGSSMEGTLNGAQDKWHAGGDFVYAFKSNTPTRGDIVIIDVKDKSTARESIIKRVIALGGDKVELRDGVLYINGEIKKEPYVLAENNTPAQNNFSEITVPYGHMFCLGDNRNVSVDSRSEIYGCFSLDRIEGIVADWSMSYKGAITAVNSFFEFPKDRR